MTHFNHEVFRELIETYTPNDRSAIQCIAEELGWSPQELERVLSLRDLMTIKQINQISSAAGLTAYNMEAVWDE